MRVTLGRPTTAEEVAYAAEAIEAAVREEMGRLRLSDEHMTRESARLVKEALKIEPFKERFSFKMVKKGVTFNSMFVAPLTFI